MSPNKYQDLILDAIDQLRRRKARPDAERIYNCLFRRKGIGSAESKVALEKCVESGVVLRVCYKGNISYRNAAKKYARQQHRAQLCDIGTGRNRPRRKFTNLLTNTFAELVLEEPDYLELGVPPLKLIRTILDKDSVRYTKKYLWILLQKEVENGGLVKLDSGNFLVGKPPVMSIKREQKEKDNLRSIKKEVLRQHQNQFKKKEEGKEFYDEDMKDDDEEEEDDEEEDDDDYKSNSNTRSNNNVGHVNGSLSTTAVGKHKRSFGLKGRPPLKKERMDTAKNQATENLRVGGRRKKAKKVFDPSESNMPKRRGRQLGITQGYKKKATQIENDSKAESRPSQNSMTEGGVCSVCHIQNKKGPIEKMISCRECSNKAHATCLNGDDMMLKMYPDNTWQCPHCKTCVICYETSDAGNLVVCSICADAYHNACHVPQVIEKIKPNMKWLCNNCQTPEQLAVDDIEIGYNIDSQKTEHKKSTSTRSTPINGPLVLGEPYSLCPDSPTLPTLSPQMTQNGNNFSLSESDKSDIQSMSTDAPDENVDPTIPDASNWSADEVTKYFAEYFPQEAQVFKEQEIDGHSLLLMRRMDVLKGLQLKLGPALKIYRHVLKLQYRRDDPKLYWV